MNEKPIKPLSKPKAKQTLTFNDGLNFGMGFFVASFLFFVCIVPIGAAVFVVFLRSIGGILGN